MTTRRWMIVVAVVAIGVGVSAKAARLWQRSVYFKKQADIAAVYEAQNSDDLRYEENSFEAELECLRDEMANPNRDGELLELRRQNIAITHGRIVEYVKWVDFWRAWKAIDQRIASHPWESLPPLEARPASVETAIRGGAPLPEQ